MLILKSRRIKKQLSAWLRDYPLLRLLIFERWFRRAFCCAAGLAALLATSTPRVWRTSPPGFLPEIKVSGLDLLQAWSLSRTARRAAAQGQFEQADFAWQTAAANNPADPKILRALLANLSQSELPPETLKRGIVWSFWLLRLRHTNEADLELTLEFFESQKQFDLIFHLLNPIRGHLTEREKINYAKTLFRRGRFAEFIDYSNQISTPASDPNFECYRRAYDLALGSSSLMERTRRNFNALPSSSKQAALAAQLQLCAAFYSSQTAEYARLLQCEDQRHRAQLIDHVRYWSLLAQTDDPNAAAHLAASSNLIPASADELIETARLLDRLGCRKRALELMASEAPRFSDDFQVWIFYGSLLESAGRWNDLRQLAIQLRQLDSIRFIMQPFSDYFEGRADLAEFRSAAAQANFQRAASAKFEGIHLELDLAARIHHLGFSTIARDLLQQHQNQLQHSTEYWDLCFEIASSLKDGPWLLLAAERSWQSTPENPVRRNHLAAALLLNRTKPERAVSLTFGLTLEQPRSNAHLINHALALAANHRNADAMCVLANIDPSQLDPLAANSYRLGEIECAIAFGNRQRAIDLLPQIDRSALWPAQLDWLQQSQLLHNN